MFEKEQKEFNPNRSLCNNLLFASRCHLFFFHKQVFNIVLTSVTSILQFHSKLVIEVYFSVFRYLSTRNENSIYTFISNMYTIRNTENKKSQANDKKKKGISRVKFLKIMKKLRRGQKSRTFLLPSNSSVSKISKISKIICHNVLHKHQHLP